MSCRPRGAGPQSPPLGALAQYPAIPMERGGCSARDSRMLGVWSRHPWEWGWRGVSLKQAAENWVPLGLLGRALCSGCPPEAVPKEGGQRGLPEQGLERAALTASKAGRPLWSQKPLCPRKHTHVGSRRGFGRRLFPRPCCSAAPVTEAWGPPGFAAPAVPSLSLGWVSAQGLRGRARRAPSCQPGHRTKDVTDAAGKLRQGLWWGVGAACCVPAGTG